MISDGLTYVVFKAFLDKADLTAAHKSWCESPLEKRQRPDFDAFARPRVGWRARIVKCGMGRPACAAILQGIVNLEDKRLVAPH
jgi:hypothetical protein